VRRSKNGAGEVFGFVKNLAEAKVTEFQAHRVFGYEDVARLEIPVKSLARMDSVQADDKLHENGHGITLWKERLSLRQVLGEVTALA